MGWRWAAQSVTGKPGEAPSPAGPGLCCVEAVTGQEAGAGVEVKSGPLRRWCRASPSRELEGDLFSQVPMCSSCVC